MAGERQVEEVVEGLARGRMCNCDILDDTKKTPFLISKKDNPKKVRISMVTHCNLDSLLLGAGVDLK